MEKLHKQRKLFAVLLAALLTLSGLIPLPEASAAAGGKELAGLAGASSLRELREETGASPGTFQSLGELYPSPGYCGEIIRMYLARKLTFGEASLDEGEFLNVERMDFARLVELVLSGEIRDAKTIAAALKTKLLLGR